MNVGIQRKFLQFDATQLLKLLTDKQAAPDEKIQQLYTRIARIYRHVSMRVRRRDISACRGEFQLMRF
jgi:hypothetical protein